MRLIDADDLKNVFEGYSCTENRSPHFPLDMVKKDIDEAPTVEAKDVVHAKWIDGCCSNCGAYIPTDSRMDFIDEEDCKFCYECGCDMRGENDVE